MRLTLSGAKRSQKSGAVSRSRRILITGAGGMLGRDLAEVLQGTAALYGIGRKARKIAGIRYFKANLTRPCELARLIRMIRPQIVIHAAAMTQVDACELNPVGAYVDNVLATHSLIEALRGLRPLLILISTDYVFRGGARGTIGVHAARDPLSVYGATKWLAERLVERGGLPYVMIRTSWLYGRHGRHFVQAILDLLKKRKRLKVVRDQQGAPTHTRDLALGIRAVVHRALQGKAVRGVYHLSAGGRTNWKDYAEDILRLSGRRGIRVQPITAAQLGRPAARPKNSVLDNGSFERKFGYRMRPWQEALKEYLEYA